MEELKKQFEVDSDLLERVSDCWGAQTEFRAERDRCKRMTYGDQWGDESVDKYGAISSERNSLRARGNVPLTNNLIRRLVRNVVGLFRNRWTPPHVLARDPANSPQAGTLDCLLQYNMELNHLAELYARSMEEYMISGMAVHKKWFGVKGNMSDCWTDIVSPANFFIDPEARDVRGFDASIVGEAHDMSFDQVCATYATRPQDMRTLRAIYGADSGDTRRRCRVWEVWTRDSRGCYLCLDPTTGRAFKVPEQNLGDVTRENRRRLEESLQRPGADPGCIRYNWMVDSRWRYAFLAPDGTLLRSGESPYDHGSHPYVWKAYPFIDGEIHSFVADIIDQQKLTNRLVTMYDWMLRSAAKGVLLVPEQTLAPGANIRDMVDQWRRFDGVITYRHKPGFPAPQQLSSKVSDFGIMELLNVQIKMMEDISGVNGALQGKLDNGSMSGKLYDQQTRNSLSAVTDLLKSFEDFILAGASVDASNIMQFYDKTRIKGIAGMHPGFSPTIDDSAPYFHTPFDYTFTAPVSTGAEPSTQ